jgi:glucokinase
VVDGEALEQKFGFRRVDIVNDFEAIIQGIPQLKPGDVEILNRGTPSDDFQTIAVLGAGTGLGQAGALYDPDQKRYRVIPSEGGHCDFSPTNEEEIHLLRFLLGRYDRVSFERVLSGPGLVNIFDCLAESGAFEGAEAVRAQMTPEDPAAVISRNALEKGDRLCTRVLDLFVSIYGTERGAEFI